MTKLPEKNCLSSNYSREWRGTSKKDKNNAIFLVEIIVVVSGNKNSLPNVLKKINRWHLTDRQKPFKKIYQIKDINSIR